MSGFNHSFINLIIKPTDMCNLRCTYCYHAEKGYDSNIMSLDTFSKICSKVFPYFRSISILWHGGEPLLMGLAFYKKTMAIISEALNKYHNEVFIRFQSNGTLINDQWIDFFKKHDVRLGLSFDGLDNDVTRGHTNEVLRAFDLLHKAEQKFGIIQVLTSASIIKITETYEYYKRLGVNVKFNYLFDTDMVTNGKDQLLSSDLYCKYMIPFFDKWFFDSSCNIRVDPFEEYVLLYLGISKTCSHNSCLGKWLSINYAGELSPCGRNYPDLYNLGNIDDYNSLGEAFNTNAYCMLLRNTVVRRNKCIEKCDLYKYCHGGCNNDKLLENGISEINGFSCKIFIALFHHIASRVNQYLDQSSAISGNTPIVNPYVISLVKNNVADS